MAQEEGTPKPAGEMVPDNEETPSAVPDSAPATGRQSAWNYLVWGLSKSSTLIMTVVVARLLLGERARIAPILATWPELRVIDAEALAAGRAALGRWTGLRGDAAVAASAVLMSSSSRS